MSCLAFVYNQIGPAVEGKPDVYLGGLLWNLQTYQDGVCPDYAFNYGKRLAPTAGDIVRFLKQAQEQHTELGLQQLLGNITNSDGKGDVPSTRTHPISAGVSCLAALPSQVRSLVPEPYRNLDIETVEQFYGDCMDKVDNTFDIKKFERLVEDKIVELGYVNGNNADGATDDGETLDQSHYWIVLAKSKMPLKYPIDPPPPFSERLSELRPNNRIKVRRIKAVWRARQREVCRQKQGIETATKAELDSFLVRSASLEDVAYKTAYQTLVRKKKQKTKLSGRLNNVNLVESQTDAPKKKIRKPDALSYQLTAPPKEFATTADGQSALACLKQLQDSGLIGEIEWVTEFPSTSSYAAFNPNEHEFVRLTVQKSSNQENNDLKEALVYEQDRLVNLVSKQAVKQHLATFAMCDIVGPELYWGNVTFKELREHVMSKNNKSRIK